MSTTDQLSKFVSDIKSTRVDSVDHAGVRTKVGGKVAADLRKSVVLTVGSINEDIFAFVSDFPAPGETKIGEEHVFRLGGKGANQSVAAAKAGAVSQLVGKVGNDSLGSDLLHELSQLGVDTSFVFRSADTATGTAHITVTQEGENSIVVIPGANGELRVQDLWNLREQIENAQIVVVQAEIPAETIAALIDLCNQAGVPTVLNLAPFIPLPQETIAKTTWLVVNELEYAALLAVDRPGTPEDMLANLKEVELPNAQMVVTLGRHGAVLVTGDSEAVHVPAPSAIRVVDTTGAGDAFVGVFATGLASGMTPLAATEWAVRAGSLVVQTRGAAPSYPDFRSVSGGDEGGQHGAA